jgi:hypothetical protein
LVNHCQLRRLLGPGRRLVTVHPERVYAAYLNLIEPWWKVIRSLALKGRSFATWNEVCAAIAAATAFWNAYRRPFSWGRRRRHRPARTLGIVLLANVR